MRYSTIGGALGAGAAALQGHSTSPRLDADLLLAHAIGEGRAYLYGHPESEIDQSEYAQYQEAIARRQQGEPVAYLTGRSGFWSLNLKVTSACLIPRPETELLVERALTHTPVEANWRLLDLGTGSGAIALAIASERPRCTVTATDISPAALDVARANALERDLTNIEFLAGDWCTPVAGRRFELVVSNPPYVASDDPHLERGDVRCEPRLALAGGAMGRDALKHIVRTASSLLKPGGWIVLEHGYDQRAFVHNTLSGACFRNIHGFNDIAEIARIIEAQAPK